MKLQRKEEGYYFPGLNPIKKKNDTHKHIIGHMITIPQRDRQAQEKSEGGEHMAAGESGKNSRHHIAAGSCRRRLPTKTDVHRDSLVCQKRKIEFLLTRGVRIKRDCVFKSWHVVSICRDPPYKITKQTARISALRVRGPGSQPRLGTASHITWGWSLPLSAPESHRSRMKSVKLFCCHP